MNRQRQLMLVTGTLLICWLGMQTIHEFGHVIGAWLTGAEVRRVILDPLTISRTDVGANPNPLFVVWAGPVLGSLLPVIIWMVAHAWQLPGAFVVRFFAGFCLITNGAYIGVGAFDEAGDCREMLLYGSPKWTLWLFGCIAVPSGLWIWHGLGREFGFGPGPSDVSRALTATTFGVSLALLLILFLITRD